MLGESKYARSNHYWTQYAWNIGVCTELGDPWTLPLYKLQTFPPHLKLCTVQPLLDTCSSSCISIGRTCSANQSMHGATIFGRVCSEHQSMHGATIIGQHARSIKLCAVQPLLDTCSKCIRFCMCVTASKCLSEHAPGRHFWQVKKPKMFGATIIG